VAGIVNKSLNIMPAVEHHVPSDTPAAENAGTHSLHTRASVRHNSVFMGLERAYNKHQLRSKVLSSVVHTVAYLVKRTTWQGRMSQTATALQQAAPASNHTNCSCHGCARMHPLQGGSDQKGDPLQV
jgi:hypothetical protein